MHEREFRRRNHNDRAHERDREPASETRGVAIAPGKRTLTGRLRGPGPARLFQLAVDEGHAQVPLLASAIAARDFEKVLVPTLCAQRCLDTARANADAVRDGAKLLEDLDRALAPLLAQAPKISEEAFRGRYYGGDRRAWDAERARWLDTPEVEPTRASSSPGVPTPGTLPRSSRPSSRRLQPKLGSRSPTRRAGPRASERT